MTALDPAVATGRNVVRSALADLGPGSRVVVAVSGGADSLALASVTAFVADRESWELRAVIVDHQLQTGSADVAALAAKQLATIGVDAEVVAVEVGRAGGPEAAARSARYAVLEAQDADAVLLAHTLDDQAETVLLGLGRGSGPRSIAGMAAVNGLFRRPFLALRRTDTEQICRAADLTWWVDPHNSDPAYRRVRVRMQALPVLEDVLGGGVAEALARTADQVRADGAYLDALADAVDDPLAVSTLKALAPALRSRVLRRSALAAGADPSVLTAAHLAEIDRLVTDWHGQLRIELPGGVACVRVGNSLAYVTTLWEGEHVDQTHVAGEIEHDQVLLTEKQIIDRLGEMAAQIEADYEGKDLLLVGVLKGAVMVMADLARSLNRHVEMDWMAISSYGSGTKSSGVVRILKDLDTDLKDRHVLVVEDIIDTGLTLSWLITNLKSRGPASVEIATLLRKPEAVTMDVDVTYVGFDIPNAFVVGYGLDYDEKYRNLRCIGTLSPHVYS